MKWEILDNELACEKNQQYFLKKSDLFIQLSWQINIKIWIIMHKEKRKLCCLQQYLLEPCGKKNI